MPDFDTSMPTAFWRIFTRRNDPRKNSTHCSPRCNVVILRWIVWPMNGAPIDRPMARSKNTQEAVRNAVGTDLSWQLSISLHVERHERVKGKKHVKAVAGWYSGANTSIGATGRPIEYGSKRIPTASVLSGLTSWFSCGFAVTPPAGVYFRHVT